MILGKSKFSKEPMLQGKRRRNRSNVEAMAAKHNNPSEQTEPELTNGRRRILLMLLLMSVVILTSDKI